MVGIFAVPTIPHLEIEMFADHKNVRAIYKLRSALYTMPQFRLFVLIDCETEILIRVKTNWETCLVTLQAAGGISRKKSYRYEID